MRAWPLVFLALAMPDSALGEDITLGEKRAVAMVVTSPRGVSVPMASSTAYRLAEEALAALGPIAVLTPEQSGFDPELLAVCPLEERLACYARTLGRARRGSEPRYLAVVSMLPFGKTAKLTSLVMDLDRALALDLGDDAEDRIYREATVTVEATVSLLVERELGAHLSKLFLAARPFFEASGHVHSTGRIELVGGQGFSLELDGRALGILVGPRTTLAEVLPGQRRLELEDPDRKLLPFARTLRLDPGAVVSLEVPRLRDPAQADATAHRLVFWGSVGLAAVGSALTLWAVQASTGGQRVAVCTEPGCDSDGRSFASFCELSADRRSECEGGVLAAPLGLGLLVAGVGSAALTELGVEESEPPWWPPLVGLAMGMVLYGLLAVVE